MDARLKNAAALAALLAAAACATSPYVDDQGRAIKALSADEAAGYREGRGLGLARPAELNGYPGPMHVLELAEGLALTPAQREATRTLMDRHKAEVRALGAEYLAQEARIEALFAERRADARAIEEATARAAELHGRIRASHLRTHLEQAALLTPAQVERYTALRGYAPK